MHGCRLSVFSAANWTCPVGYSRCYGSRQCVLEYYFDDGENDCNIGTDEFAELGVRFQTLSHTKHTCLYSLSREMSPTFIVIFSFTLNYIYDIYFYRG